MRQVYCSNCGKQSPVHRRALPKYGTIIDIVEPHTCDEQVNILDLTPVPVPAYVPEPKGKFVEKINELQPPQSSIDTTSLGDRRSVEHIKSSSAPTNLLEQLKRETDLDEE